MLRLGRMKLKASAVGRWTSRPKSANGVIVYRNPPVTSSLRLRIVVVRLFHLRTTATDYDDQPIHKLVDKTVRKVMAENKQKKASISKPTADIHWRSNLNKRHHLFNEAILKDALLIRQLLAHGSHGSNEQAHDLFDVIINRIHGQQRLIQIADKSEHSWKTIVEYEDDELAEDSSDGRKLRAAEARAAKKQKVSVTNRFSRFASQQTVPFGWRPDRFNGTGGSGQNVSSYRRTFGNGTQNTSKNVNRQYLRCHACGELGHFQNRCPKRGQTGAFDVEQPTQ